MRKIHLNKKRLEELKTLKKQLEREEKLRKLLLVALGLSLNGCIYLSTRGGSADFIDVDYIKDKCIIENGIRYLNNNRLRNIIQDLYNYKRKGQIIYITATAICHLANRYGQTFLVLPFAIENFGLTNIYQTFRKAFASFLIGSVGPLYMSGNPAALMLALILGGSGLRLAFNNLDFIATSPIDETVLAQNQNLQPRIPGRLEIVVVNNKKKIIMSEPVETNSECWLGDQHLLNKKCNVKSIEMPDGIDLVSPNLKYDDTVNRQDITGLDRVQFSDKFDLGETKARIYNPRKGKEVNFLDKFGDSETVDSSKSWDIYDNQVNQVIDQEKRRNLRTRN